MNVLDSPLEALAFNYVSFGLFTVVNNLWTWVAVLTAAVSFWRLRPRGASAATGTASRSAVSSSFLKLHSPPSNYDLSSNGSSPVPEMKPSEATKHPPSSVPAAVPLPCKFEDGRVKTKGLKFALYFEDDSGYKSAVEEETEKSGGDDGVAAVGCGEWWEGVLRLRTGEEMGWYRHQDLTELNGNVVRLWDGCRVGETHCSSNAKRCVVW